MKKYLLGGAAALVMGAGAASAADLPNRYKGPVAPVYVPPAFTWTGFYAGINAGYGFDTGSSSNNRTLVTSVGGNIVAINPGSSNFGRNSDNEGFVGGGQIGYNFQFGQGSGFVVGIEADIQYADLGGDRDRNVVTGTINGAPFALSGGIGTSSLDYFGTVRGRIGYAFDRVLVFGTGGFAYGNSSSDRRTFVINNQFFTTNNGDDFRTGYAVGGGVEFALPTNSFLNVFSSSAVTFKIEGLYVNLERDGNNNGNGGFNFAGSPALNAVTIAANRRDTEFAVVRAGLNFKF